MAKRMSAYDAREILIALGMSDKPDFCTLNSYRVSEILDIADFVKYRAPKNANGSRARYFYSYVCRRAQ